MPQLSRSQLQRFRDHTFRLLPNLRLNNVEKALRFVEERGFIYFWPIKGILLPSLWMAVAGDRPVPDNHDDPGHVTWGWKDDMLDKRRWYYAKILRGKATLVSLDVAPYFYALSQNYGDPDQDYLQLYLDGLLSQPAKLIYEALLDQGPLDTVNLRRTIHMTSKSSNSPFERGLVELQRDFKILPVGIAQTGAWRYSFIYEVVHRYYPRLPDDARAIQLKEARRRLTALYVASMGAVTAADVRRLFQWKPRDVQHTLDALVADGCLHAGYTLEGQTEAHYVSPEVLERQ